MTLRLTLLTALLLTPLAAQAASLFHRVEVSRTEQTGKAPPEADGANVLANEPEGGACGVRLESDLESVPQKLAPMAWLRPLWQGTTVYRESCLPLAKDRGAELTLPLLYPATRITEVVVNATGERLQEGHDWFFRRKKLATPPWFAPGRRRCSSSRRRADA